MNNSLYNQLQACALLLAGKKIYDTGWDDKNRYIYYDKNCDCLIVHHGKGHILLSLADFFNDYAGEIEWVEYVSLLED